MRLIDTNSHHAAARTSRRDSAPGVYLRLGGALACALAALLALTPLAGAAEPRYPMKAEQIVRTAPYTSASTMGTVWNGELVEIHCQDWGSSVQGSKLWNYIQYDVDGRPGIKKRGWVPDYYVKTGTTQPLSGVRQGDCPKPEVEGDRGQPRPAVGPTPRPPAPPPATPPATPPASSPAGCAPAQATGQVRMTVSAYRGRSRRAGRNVTTGDAGSVTIRGRLTTPDGAPIRGARICVAVREARPYAPLNAGAVAMTDANGAFSYEPPSGPSRRVWFVHPGRDGLAAESVLVNVRPHLRLRPSRKSLRNGQTLLLSGALRSKPAPKGVLVELQTCRSRSCSGGRGRWQTFGTTNTRNGGRFRFRYHFTRTVGVQRYTLRARVPSQPGYAYTTGASRAVRVRVSG